MKKIIILMVCLWGLGNTFTSAQTTEKEKFISSLMKQMTLDEKIGQLAQCTYRGNFTGPDGGNIPKEEYVRQGRIGSMLNVIGVKDIRRYQELALQSRLRIPLISDWMLSTAIVPDFRFRLPRLQVSIWP